MTRIVTAGAVIIGNEILSGRTQDGNLAYLARGLNKLGVRLVEARVVRDDDDAIAEAVNALRAQCDYVFTTGGIGPTHDDITARSLAKAFGVPCLRNPDAVAILERFYADSEHPLNEARLSMADMPAGAELVDNPVSGAPGFRMENVFVFAGVPRIMQAMFESMKHRLVGGAPVRSRSVAVDLPEGAIAETLARLEAGHPGVEIGSYPYYRSRDFGVKLVLRSVEEDRLATATEALIEALRALGGKPFEETVGAG